MTRAAFRSEFRGQENVWVPERFREVVRNDVQERETST